MISANTGIGTGIKAGSALAQDDGSGGNNLSAKYFNT